MSRSSRRSSPTRRRREPDDTRRRIVEATVALHEEVGPMATTISAIAERAGVQRLTVYRHFADDAALVDACSSHWAASHILPDPARWAGESDPRQRLQAALTAIYAYFRDGARMLGHILRDESAMPPVAAAMAAYHAWFAEVAGQLAAGWGVPQESQRLVRAAVRHAVRFETWRALADDGVTDEDAVAMMVALVAALGSDRRQDDLPEVAGRLGAD